MKDFQGDNQHLELKQTGLIAAHIGVTWTVLGVPRTAGAAVFCSSSIKSIDTN